MQGGWDVNVTVDEFLDKKTHWSVRVMDYRTTRQLVMDYSTTRQLVMDLFH